MNGSYIGYIERVDDAAVLDWALALGQSHSLVRVETISGIRSVISNCRDITRMATFQDAIEVLPPHDGLYFATRFAGAYDDDIRGYTIRLVVAWRPAEEVKPFAVTEFLSSKFGIIPGGIKNHHWTNLNTNAIPPTLQPLRAYYDDVVYAATVEGGTVTPENPTGTATFKVVGILNDKKDTVLSQAIEVFTGNIPEL